MEKTVHIDGMMCMHCAGKVQKALEALGLEVKVELENKLALVKGDADNEAIQKAVADKGFTVTSIE